MKIQVEGLDEVIKKLEKLSDRAKVEEIGKKAVEAAKGTALNAAKSAVAASEYGRRSTGSIAASMEVTEAKVNQYGAYAVVRPTGRDAKGERNGAKAAYLEYGTPTLGARPWRSQAASAPEEAVKSLMEEVIRAEMELE